MAVMNEVAPKQSKKNNKGCRDIKAKIDLA